MRHRLAILIALVALSACGSAPTATGPGDTTVATVAVTPAAAALTTGGTSQLAATPRDAAGNALTGQTITWTASPTTVATVSASGLVTAVSAGTATVTAAAGGKSGSAAITVTAVTTTTTVGPAGGTVSDPNSAVTLTFPAGALTTAMPISVTALASLPVPPSGYIGTPYDLGPTGTQFAQPVTLTIPYSPASLPAGYDQTRLALYTLVGSTWTRSPGSGADTVAHTVTGPITHFSGWTACGDPCYITAPDVGLYTRTNGLNFTALAGQTTHIPANGREYNFEGSVTITPEGLPAGVIGSVGSYTADNSPLSITFNVPASLPGGSYPFTMHFSAPGVALDFALGGTLQVIGQSYTMTVDPLNINLEQGRSGTATVNIARQGAFTGAIALSIANLPSGVTASFSPASVDATATTATLTFVASASAALGAASPVVRAKTPTLADATSTLALFISSSTASGFTIAGTPATIHVTSGQSGQTGVQATRTGGFAGTITYVASGMPAGMSASVAPTAVADSVALSVVAGSVAIGNYPITVTATSGSTVRTTTVSVEVAAPGHLAMHLDYSHCSTARPVWVGYQDGALPFAHVTGVGDVYDFTFSAGTGAIVVVTPVGAGDSTGVMYGTQSELSALGSGTCAAPVGKSVNFSVVNPSATVGVGMGGAYNSVPSGNIVQTGMLTNVLPGPQDVTAFLAAASPKMILRRGQDIANGGALAPFDFTTGEAFGAALLSVSVPGASTFQVHKVRDSECHTTPIYRSGDFNSATAVYGVPAAQQLPDDLYFVAAFAGTTASSVSAERVFHGTPAQSFAFGAPLNASVAVNSTTPYKQLSASTNVGADYVTLRLYYSDGTNAFAATVSTAYAGGTQVALATPALSGAIGYLPAWAPSGAVQYQLGAGSAFPGCVDGSTGKGALLFGTM